MTWRALCLLPFLAMPVAAQNPEWVGYWTENNGWCKNAGNVGEETPDQYTPTGIFGLEWSCEITSVTPIGIGKSWKVHKKCLDAGDEYNADSIFVITHLDRLLIVNQDGYTSELLRCEKLPE